MTETPDPEIICEKRGRIGLVTLNRPRALNALSLPMIRGLARALDEWEEDPAVSCVVIRGAGERAFCAGGDIRHLHDLGKAGRIEEARAFWAEEYVLDCRIQAYPKPYVALIDGIVMGAGVGLSLYGSHRVATEKYLFAMPEVGIGFFPDVGASHALPRLPGAAGVWLAVSGDRIGQADALALGLATHAAASASLPALIDALAAGEEIDAALARFAAPAGSAPMERDRALIDHAFSAPTMEEIMGCLDRAAGDGDAFAERAAKSMRTKSPTSMKIALEQMRRGRNLSFTEAMRMEFRIVSRIVLGGDFYEGVRAVIIDKDQSPRWSPARLEDVSPAMVEAHFAPLPDELPV